jgi:hypothetical protein
MTAPSTTIRCPGCGLDVENVEVHAMFMGDVVNRPLHIAKCVTVGVVVGVLLGLIIDALIPAWREAGIVVGSLLGGLIAARLAQRYNARMRAAPVDLWPNSVTCPRCGRVFGRYQEGDRPPVSAWP